MAVELSLYVAVVVFSVHAAHSPIDFQGLSCLNDFVKSITCTWKHPPFDRYSECWISGCKTTYVTKGNSRFPEHIFRSCKLKQHGDAPGCTFSFDKPFDSYETMPINVTCNGTSVQTNHTWSYKPKEHIKMNAPGTPNVSSSTNMTRISWNPGSPRSHFITSFNFQVQIKHSHQTWNEANNLPTQDLELQIWKKLKGPHEVRVRVKADWKSHWSDWSPTTSWVAADTEATSQKTALNRDEPSLLTWSLLCLGLTAALLLIFYRLLRKKPVPNPSKYFHTLHSIHGGNLKKWLNPLAASESFFMVHPHEEISAVEVCDTWDVQPSISPCSISTTALFHFSGNSSSEQSCPVDHLSSSSSSGFFNMGYFISSDDSSLAQTHPSPYFSYQGNVLSPHKKHHLSSFNSSSTYESLQRVPQSPDSGFGFMGKLDEQDVEDNDFDDNQCFPLLLHLPPVTSFPLAPSPHASGLVLMDDQGMEMDEPSSPAASENLSAWPGTGSMFRASSLPVDPCKTGYLTLKELQTTFSNKSI